ATFARSKGDRGRLAALYRVSPEKIFVAPNGVDTAGIAPVSDAEQKIAKRRLGLDGHDVLLFVGSFHPPNVEALEHLITTVAPRTPDAVFVIAGSVARSEEHTSELQSLTNPACRLLLVQTN